MDFDHSTDTTTVNSLLDAMLVDFVDTSLATKRREVMNEINELRDKIQYDRFLHDGVRWDCRAESRAMITGAVALVLANGGNLPPEFVFRDYDNINHPFTGTQMVQLGAALFAFTSQCYQASWIHKYCVGILTTAEEIDQYDYTVGWPLVG